MTTVIQTTNTQPGGYPPPQQQGYPPPPQQQGYPTQQQGYPTQQQQQGYPSGYPQGGYQPQQTTYIQAPPTTIATGGISNRNDRYNKKAALVTGIMQICAGGILVVLGIIVLVLGSWYRMAWNIWGSVCFYVVTGILGVVSKNQNRCVIIAYMVMSIISAVCAGSQMIYDAAAAGNARHLGWAYCGGYHHTDWYNYYDVSCGRQKAIMAMHALSALTGLAEMILAIVASAYCCSGCCRSSTPATQTTVVTYAQPAPPGPQVTMVSGAAYPPPTTYHQAPPVNVQPPAYTQQQAQPMNPQQPGVYEEPVKS
ncbi:uncharacterized protein [Amphiura filiformis]|uniref:uncharacterized protein n=1 Tax=Amphiura filiformis TaxID=82378 RepID=UPI003B227C54